MFKILKGAPSLSIIKTGLPAEAHSNAAVPEERSVCTQISEAKPARMAGYGDWYPRGIDSVKKVNPMYNPLTLTWGDGGQPTDAKGNLVPTVLSLNATKKQKSSNRRIQITFVNPPHHGKGRSATSYDEE